MSENTGAIMLLIVESKKSLKEVCDVMEPTAQKHKFGVLGVHNLKEAMVRKGVAFDRECFVYEVCNPHQAKNVLEARMEISTALPCRISIYEERGKVKLATIRPTEMIASFRAAELTPVAQEVEKAILAIMTEAAGS